MKVVEFKSWLNRTGGSPSKTVHRQKLRAISERYPSEPGLYSRSQTLVSCV